MSEYENELKRIKDINQNCHWSLFRKEALELAKIIDLLSKQD